MQNSHGEGEIPHGQVGHGGSTTGPMLFRTLQSVLYGEGPLNQVQAEPLGGQGPQDMDVDVNIAASRGML
jgi:hypothetical protein